MNINQPLANTYGWLRVNASPLPDWRASRAPALIEEARPAGVEREDAAAPGGLKTGAGSAIDPLFPAPAVYAAEADAKPEEPLRLRFDGTEAAACAALVLRPGSELTCVMRLDTEKGARGALRTLVDLGDNAVLRLVQVQSGGGALVNDLGVRCGAHARFELTRLILDSEQTWDGCSVALEGAGSAFEADIGYRLSGDERLDMNIESIHTGRKTDCAIRAAGVLSGRADKLFRGTIDLRTGCGGATGAETEDVLLMDETVRNRTVPVILCAEEDVSGSHGASVGRPNEERLFYLVSRGLTREAALELLARAQIEAVIRRIPDQTTRRALLGAGEQEENG